MISKRIEKMNIGKLAKEIGFPIDLDIMRECYIRDEMIAPDVKKFEHEIEKIKNANDILTLMEQYDHIFDKGQFIFQEAKVLEKDLNEGYQFGEQSRKIMNASINGPFRPSREKALKKCKELLKEVDDIFFTKVGKKYIIETTQEYLGNTEGAKRRKAKNEEKIRQIDSTIGLKKVLSFVTPVDLMECCRYKNLANQICIDLYNLRAKQKKAEKNGDYVSEDVSDYNYDADEFEKVVREYAQYIDLDKLLLLSNALYYSKYENNFQMFSKDEFADLEEYTKAVASLLDKKNIEMELSDFSDPISISALQISVQTIHNHFVGGKFRTSEELDKINDDAIIGKFDIRTLTPEEYRNIIKLNNEEMAIMLSQEGILEHLVENGLIDSKKLSEIIKLKKDFSGKQYAYLLSNDIITPENLIKLYMEDIANIDSIRDIQENHKEIDLSQAVSEKTLVGLYLDEEQKENFDKYRRIYKIIKINGKENNELVENAGLILEQSDKLMEEERLYDLYHMGLLPIDVIVDFIGPNAITKLYISGELKPNDANILYKNGIFTEEMLDLVLQNKGLSDNQKLVLIYSTFSSYEKKDEEKREELIKKYLDDVSKPINKKVTKGIRAGQGNNTSPSKYNKSILDPFARWNLISNLDRDYSQEYLEDGNIIFYLPNHGKYIIEKVFTQNKEPAYGVATYIVDEDTFEAHAEEIVQNSKVNTSVLVALRKEQVKGVKKIVHTGWANSIIKFFNIEESKKYSEEEKNEIKRLAECVQKSKRPFDRNEK